MAHFTYLVPADGIYPGKTVTFQADGSVKQIKPANSSMVFAEKFEFGTFDEMCDQIYLMIEAGRGFIVRGDVSPDYIGVKKAFRRKLGTMGDGSVLWRGQPQWICLDVDGVPMPAEIDPTRDAEEAIQYVISTLPPYFHDVSCFWQFSSSQSLPGNREVLKCHLFYFLKNSIPEAKLKEWAKSNRTKHHIDPAVMSSNQPIYIAPPMIHKGKDPLDKRNGVFHGTVDILNLDPFAQRQFGQESNVTPLDQRRLLSKHLEGKIGDGEGRAGFNEPIKSAIAAVLARAGADVDREVLKKDIREYIRNAPSDPDRKGRKKEEYGEDEYLDALIEALAIREKDSRTQTYNQYESARARYVYVTNLNRFYDTVSGNFIAKEALNLALSKIGRHIAEVFANDDDFIIVDQLTYYPGRERICAEESIETGETSLCFNLYQPPRVLDEPAILAQPFMDHMKNLAGDDTVYKHIMDWLAFNVQYPGVKIMYAMLIQGKQGTGKSAVMEAMKGALGQQNVRMTEVHELSGQFSSWAKGKQMVVIEEIRDTTDRFGVYNRMKPVITSPILNINEKNIPAYQLPNRMNIMAFTNYELAVPMDDDDRRFLVHFSPMEPQSEDYYTELFDCIEKHPGAIRRALMEWDLTDFNPKGRAPSTESKRFLQENAGPPVTRYLKEAMLNEEWPFKYDLVVPRDLHEALAGKFKVTDSTLTVILRSLGATNLGQKRLEAGKRHVWAVRRSERWKLASESEIKAHYKKPVIDHFTKSEGYEGGEHANSKERPEY